MIACNLKIEAGPFIVIIRWLSERLKNIMKDVEFELNSKEWVWVFSVSREERQGIPVKECGMCKGLMQGT